MLQICARDSKHPAFAGSQATRLSEGIINLICEMCTMNEYLRCTRGMANVAVENMKKCVSAFHRLVPAMRDKAVTERDVKILAPLFRIELQCDCSEQDICTCGGPTTRVRFYFQILIDGDWEDYNVEDVCMLEENDGVLTLRLCNEE